MSTISDIQLFQFAVWLIQPLILELFKEGIS